MNKTLLKKLIDISAGRIPADLVIKNCNVADVYNASVIKGDIAVCEGLIAGIGKYEGNIEVDAKGRYAAPALSTAIYTLNRHTSARRSWAGLSYPTAQRRSLPIRMKSPTYAAYPGWII